MRLLVCIWHPAHVHFFKNVIDRMKKKGHDIVIITYDKEHTITLLEKLNFKYLTVGKHSGKNPIKKCLNLFYIQSIIYKIITNNNIDLIVGIAGVYPSFISKLLDRKYYSFTDTEHAFISQKLTVPFSNKIFTPSCFKSNFGKKHIRYNGYHELAYLHPNNFSPDESVLDSLQMQSGEKYAILRFVSWEAMHDLGYGSISLESKIHLVKSLSKHLKVFISSECELDKDLEKYKLDIAPEKIHDVLYFSSLYIGDGATMASESVVLGTPAIYFNKLTAGTIEEQVQYGLMFRETNEKLLLKKSLEIINDIENWHEKKAKLLNDKIDVTKFILDAINNT